MMMDLLQQMCRIMDDRAASLATQAAYYDGTLPRLVLSDSRVPSYSQIIDQAKTPWAQLVVDIAAERMAVEGFRVVTPGADDDAGADALCWDIWAASDADLWSQMAFQAMLLHARAFLLVEPAAAGELPSLSFEPPSLAAVLPGPGRRAPVAAVKRWRSGDGKDTAVLWTAGSAATYTSDPRTGGAWTAAADQLAVPVPGAVPMFEMRNRAALDGGAASDLDGLYPALDRAAQSTADRLTAQMYGSTKVRYLIGVEPETGEDGRPTEAAMRMAVDRLLFVEDPNAKIGALPETDLRPLIEAQRADIAAIASISRLPVHLLSGDLTNLSAEALRSIMDGLAARVVQRQAYAATALQRGMRLALHLAGDDRVADPRTRIEVIWADPLPQALSDMASAAATLVQSGVLSKSAAQDYALSLTPTQIGKYAQLERSDALNQQGVAAIADLFTGPLPPQEEAGV